MSAGKKDSETLLRVEHAKEMGNGYNYRTELTVQQIEFCKHPELILCELCGLAVIPPVDWHCSRCDASLPDMKRTDELRVKYVGKK